MKNIRIFIILILILFPLGCEAITGEETILFLSCEEADFCWMKFINKSKKEAYKVSINNIEKCTLNPEEETIYCIVDGIYSAYTCIDIEWQCTNCQNQPPHFDYIYVTKCSYYNVTYPD